MGPFPPIGLYPVVGSPPLGLNTMIGSIETNVFDTVISSPPDGLNIMVRCPSVELDKVV